MYLFHHVVARQLVTRVDDERLQLILGFRIELPHPLSFQQSLVRSDAPTCKIHCFATENPPEETMASYIGIANMQKT